MSEPEYHIEVLWGVKELKPVEMRFVLKSDGYYIETDYCSWGPWAAEEIPQIIRIAKDTGMVVSGW